MKALKLNATQIRSLLHAIDTKQLVSVQFDDNPTEANGLLLGGDLLNAELLLCDTHPDVSSDIVRGDLCQTFWLRIKTLQSYLRLRVVAKSIENGLITVGILSCSSSMNKRWHNRVEFAPLKGPIARINREFTSNLDARIKDLSAKGAAIDIWGKELNRTFKPGQEFDTTFIFNRHFELAISCIVLSSQFVRVPSCHTSLRVHFNHLDSLSYCQLSHFIDATELSSAA